MIFKLITLLLLGALAAAECPADRKKKADKCAQEAFFVTDLAFVPAKTVPEHDAYCTKNDNSINCIRQYGKDCLKGFTAQTLTTALHGMKKGHKVTCKKDSDKQTFMKHTAWVTKAKNAALKECVDKAITNMEFIAKNVTQNDQIPQSCCSYWLTRKCLTAKLKEHAPNQETRDYLENFWDTTMTSLINFLCSKQNSLSACQTLMPAAMTRMSKVFGNPVVPATSDSFLITFLEVVVDI